MYDEMIISRWSPAGQAGHLDILGVYCGPETEPEPEHEPEPYEVHEARYGDLLPILGEELFVDFFEEWEPPYSQGDEAQAESIAAKWYSIAAQAVA